MKKIYMAAIAVIYAATSLFAGDKIKEEQVYSSIKPKISNEYSDNRLFGGPPPPISRNDLKEMVLGDDSADPTKTTTDPTYIVTDEQLGNYHSQPRTEPETMGDHIRGLDSSIEEDEGGSFKSLIGTKPTTASLPKTPLTSEQLEEMLWGSKQ
ncbi:MAG: hypothetical protein U9R08_04440 [Nanoarchaeota archaeon]|nr:hypothetical protein [Nanoarchaeota archaeon]